MSHDPTPLSPARPPTHRAARRLTVALVLLVLAPLLGVAAPALASDAGRIDTGRIDTGRIERHPTHQPGAAREVARGHCRSVDPNLVHGACLTYRAGGRSSLTWIGSYRAPSGRTFFCIDYLYDSRLPAHARVMSTRGLVNQLGDRVGTAEVAALNAVVSRWAGHGSTGSDVRDAAIALIVREVMDDGVRGGGAGGATVVYPGGLTVGRPVRAPRGGVSDAVLAGARQMWTTASRERGPFAVELAARPGASGRGELRLGRSRTYRVAVRSASGRLVAGLPVTFSCRGPVRCPAPVESASEPVELTVSPHDVGRFRMAATATGPASDGRLFVAPGWHTHGGTTARDAGTQRGWIAGGHTVHASVSATAVIVRARPTVTTTTSDQLVLPGAALHDDVVVSGVPSGYDRLVTARLFGPYAAAPTSDDCAPGDLVGHVRLRVSGNGRFASPALTVGTVGHYVWQETLPGDRFTEPVTTPCSVASETTLVHRLTPSVATVVSDQRVVVGRPLHDTVRVSGVERQPVTVRWTLHGPVPPRAGACRDVDWTTAPVAARGSLAFTGDGVRRTEPTVVRAAGCYTYGEQVLPTATTDGVASPPGSVGETSLVTRRTPHLHTVASTHWARTGALVHDVVHVSGVTTTDRYEVHWRLLGPIAPAGAPADTPATGSCAGVDWTGAPLADHGTMRVSGSGDHATPSTRLTAPGCYTYAESLPASPTTTPASTSPGLTTETVYVVRPPLPATPVVPSGVEMTAGSGTGTDPRFYRAPARLVRPSVHARVEVPSVGVDAPLDAVGLDGRTLAVPGDTHHVGWLTRSAALDDVVGATVLAGHVSDRHDRPGALWRLHGVRVGALVTVVDDDGATHRFRVSHLARYPRTRGLPAEVFRTDGPHVLQLVTCTDRQTTGGYFHYADNLVVTAVPVVP